MPAPDELMPIKDHVPGLAFIVRLPFRNEYFLIATIVFALDLLICGILLTAGWQYLTSESIVCVAVVAIFFTGTWRIGFRAHQNIHLLFAGGQIEKVEKGSPLDKILGVSCDLILTGLLSTGLVSFYCLLMFQEAIFRH